jgi:hypothetical protein
MDDVFSKIRDRHVRAQQRLERARRALEAAEVDVADLEAALRVMAQIAPGPAGALRYSHSDQVAERQLNLIKVLPNSRILAVEPKPLSERYAKMFPKDDAGLDVLRTTLWRMKDRTIVYPYDGHSWRVASASGRYWKERVDAARPKPEAPID